MLHVILASALLFAEGAAPAGQAPQQAVPADIAQAQAEDKADPIICKRQAELGTKIPRKVCLRKSQREEMARAAREATDEIQRSSVFRPANN